MDVKFLGVGGAFDPEWGSSSALIDAGRGQGILIDCGATTYGDLRRTGLIDQVTHILITHCHDDHVGSLGSTIFHASYVSQRKLHLMCPPGLTHSLRTLLGLQTTASLDQVVHFHEMGDDPNDPERLAGDTRISWVDTKGLHQPDMQTYAYILRQPSGTFAYSGDLGDPNVLFNALAGEEQSRVLVCHDVSFRELPNHAHAYYKDIEKHLPRWNALGYHNNPDQMPSDCTIPLVAALPDIFVPR